MVGISGIGKTALAECLAENIHIELLEKNWSKLLIENFDSNKDEKKNYIEGYNHTPDFTSTAKHWLEKWGEQILPEQQNNSELIMLRLLHRLRNRPYLIILDSVEWILKGNEQEGWSDFKDEQWSKFFNKYISSGQQCASRIIVTSQEFPRQIDAKYQSFWHCHNLKGLNATEQLELFDKTGLEVEEYPNRPYLKRIGAIYEGHPLALKVIAGEIGSEKYNGDLEVYWEECGKEIEEVERAIQEAKNKEIISSKDDEWKLHNYTRDLRCRVQDRLEKSFEKLKFDHYNAYYLLCAAAIYRYFVKKSWWLEQLDDLDCNNHEKQIAFEVLEDRYLVEWGKGLLVRQHNLIRSLALDYLKKIDEELDE